MLLTITDMTKILSLNNTKIMIIENTVDICIHTAQNNFKLSSLPQHSEFWLLHHLMSYITSKNNV